MPCREQSTARSVRNRLGFCKISPSASVRTLKALQPTTPPHLPAQPCQQIDAPIITTPPPAQKLTPAIAAQRKWPPSTAGRRNAVTPQSPPSTPSTGVFPVVTL